MCLNVETSCRLRPEGVSQIVSRCSLADPAAMNFAIIYPKFNLLYLFYAFKQDMIVIATH